MNILYPLTQSDGYEGLCNLTAARGVSCTLMVAWEEIDIRIMTINKYKNGHHNNNYHVSSLLCISTV